MRTVRIETFGCKVNQYESEYMAEQLEKAGYTVLPAGEASYYIINSCVVTQEVEKKVKRLVKSIRRKNRDAKIILTGCFAQLFPEEAKKLPVNMVLGISEKKNIVDHLLSLNGEQKLVVSAPDSPVYEKVKGSFEDRTRAYIKVEDGCDNGCTYCAIRFARGTKVRSKPLELFKEEFEKMVIKGYKEIVITGVNLGKYGKDIGTTLVDLLKIVEHVPGDYRVRLSSLNVEDITDELVEVFRDNPRLCPHLHISVQSGSDRVLKRMGRRYSSSDFLKVVEKLRSINPDFSITTDIIVGFPGETDEDFLKTVKLLEEVEFSRVHIFRYSPRPGTPASTFSDAVPEHKKKERLNILKEKAKEVSHRYKRRMVNKKRRVLAEWYIAKGVLSGYDEYYVKHEFVGDGIGVFHNVRVKSLSEEGVISCRVDLAERAVHSRG
ncbi:MULTISPECIES: tRNA (N(6)-L-threonylcarbamoyladenosine(37)-C(2))-methylthiotransferase MtaB [Thermotoga]|uniref:Threonylcarbamoyladenosine tRNA methylthiotransferase MtaB n=1 Tax=Thermotoga neapolitana (strain ATCC 49049 / DSM 4359 / NBRC 107923 / NS-E) TaxID=309803 RepID=B9KAD9_THENN|nr:MULTISPECIES: tRNA (N(6)-L-threonylcarbamoyladenosine(37)-C(2))-methylthiotransferase MtaB [Thermotoga]MDK2785364.1 threonylcarbamoyladenosine tRNA methylthiotransferase MtaB [Thermotoga sp.]HBF10666.1 tRNA (N(6)-L-threonylcarbamoyladenosine(37)-C(2))-methylthiotransferase MtaB [Thermotoga neapolitana]ACM23922.1 MiaB-like tRNA modifying enzyme [Thermotoga neapolitana DSM 4359]AJG39951.1 radical SAM protein [Thermotoga sp. RQ7]KFZ21025.1 MiaB-like tRNA modifying enzyme [Thermotoga neapolitan